jgi:hypothetical protein
MKMDDQLVPYIPNTGMWLVDESVLGLLSFENVESQEFTERWTGYAGSRLGYLCCVGTLIIGPLLPSSWPACCYAYLPY